MESCFNEQTIVLKNTNGLAQWWILDIDIIKQWPNKKWSIMIFVVAGSSEKALQSDVIDNIKVW